MHLQDQEPLVGHRAEIAVEAVDHDDARAVLLHAGADIGREFSGREFSRIDLLYAQFARCQGFVERLPDRPRACLQRAAPLVEGEKNRSEERRVGKEGVRQVRTRLSPSNEKKKTYTKKNT